MSTFEEVLKQYEKNKNTTSGNKNRVSQEERLKRYFTTVLDKGKTTGEKRVRILPTKDGSSPFVEVKFHELQVDGKWLKLYDPAQEGKRSPLNEVHDNLKLSGTQEDFELSKAYKSRTFYIVKVIDRDNEQDGPKFWRFKFSYKNEGIHDKIIPIFRNKGDITDPKEGRDLILSLTLNKANNGKEYTTINSILNEDISPLHEDEAIAKEWLDNDLVWSDVYAMKGEDYLDLVARGETPKWDTVNNRYVSASAEEETVAGSTEPKESVSQASIPDPQEDDSIDEDLPF